MRNLSFALLVAITFPSFSFAEPPARTDPNAAQGIESKLIAYFNCKTGEKIADAKDIKTMSIGKQFEIAASGFCELAQYTNGTYYCKSGSCTGSCSLKNVPVHCSCD